MNKIKIEHFFNKEYQLNEEQKLYLKIHAKRFEIILSNITHQHSAKVLDIGPSFLSYLLYQKFGENLNYNNNIEKWVNLSPGNYSNFIVTIVDQNLQDINIIDSNLLINFLIRVKN